MRNRERGVPFAKKSLGQNFLADRNVVRAIVDGLGIGDQERVVEIGPGRGALTSELLARGAEVTAIEIDRDLVPEL
ncbi:MAG TPA: rRNA adenine N-6-methyltransferase family protein, partial [Pyrinomonadaceae bacterium]|nr:rRNA adenine N-6-methyltransferase family protein [Pyrinomonadaceae bacterium]